MKNTLAGLSALAVCTAFLLPAEGADDVTQPAFFRCFRRQPPPPRPTYFVAAPAQPCCPQPACPQTTCTQTYSLQSYYRQVTSYRTQTNYELVTNYQTSYYYEPVTTYRTSCYYCPNTCQYKQVQIPETQYVLRSRTCPVQNYVAKCVQVPVTSCEKVYYYQPQTVCTQTPACCPAPQPACCPQPMGAVGGPPPALGGVPMNPPDVTGTPGVPGQMPPTGQPPIIRNEPYYNPPNVTGTPGAPGQVPPIGQQPPIIRNEPYYKGPPSGNTMPPANGNGSSWQPGSPPTPAPIPTAPMTPKAHTVTLNRIVLGADATVEGEVVHGDKSPRSGAKLLFVNVNQPNMRETVTANHAGRFQVTLPPGGWLVYIYNLDGNAVYHSRIEVGEENMGRIVLVSR